MAMTQSALLSIEVGEGSVAREWVLVELQGEVQVNNSTNEEQSGEDLSEISRRRGKSLGSLMNQNSDNPVLIIGNNKLEGKRMKMPKPLAILRKVGRGYEAQGIVTQKLVFKTRPKPLTTASKD